MLNDSENAECEELTEETQQAPPAKRPRIRMDVIHPPGTFNIQLRNKSSLNKVEESKEHFPNHDETVSFLDSFHFFEFRRIYIFVYICFFFNFYVITYFWKFHFFNFLRVYIFVYISFF